ncbi:MAG: hypothetical protein LV473_16790 [Nitrospira sp.]|nr:hypothetical protein [Nitrospira sp.]
MKVVTLILWSILVVVSLLLGIGAVVSWKKVQSGHGLDAYFSTSYLVDKSSIDLLVLIAVIPLAFLLVWAIHWWQLREERDFKKKFNIKE